MTNGPLVIDTSALLAVLFVEDDAQTYAQALLSSAERRMAAPTWVESMQVATARRGNIGQEGLQELLIRLDVEVVAFDAGLARMAYEAWLHFGKGRHPAALNFGDCFSYALAKQRGEPLLFKGDDFSRTDLTAAL
jgi:ribonuclease VapC